MIMQPNFGQWQEGETYDVRTGNDGRDHYPNNFEAVVEIRNRASGEIQRVTGHGEFTGNFSFIWVKVKEGKFGTGHSFRRRDKARIESRGWQFLTAEEILRL